MPYYSRTQNYFAASNLHDHLEMLTVDTLRRMMATLAVPKPRPTRKAEMISAITSRLADDSFLQNLWSTLGRTEQLAVRDALYDSDRQLDTQRFRARHGASPPKRSQDLKPLSPVECFLHVESRYTSRISTVPKDLAERLRAFVPPPAKFKLAAKEKLPEFVERKKSHYTAKGKQTEKYRVELVRRDMERTASRDLGTMLRLVDLGQVAVSAKTLRPSAAAMQRISAELDGGDFFGPNEKKYDVGKGVGSIRAFAWPLILQAGKLAEIHGSKLALTKAGRSALAAPPKETLKHLWERWINYGVLDEFSRIDTINGQSRGKGRRSTMTDASDRRFVVDDALMQCTAGQWVRLGDFSRFMQAEKHDFEVTNDPWKLYIGESRYGSLGYDGCHGWEILQERYILCLLFEYAAALGLIDVAYSDPENARPNFRHLDSAYGLTFLSRYDGLEYFRINPLGAYCLGIESELEPAGPPVPTPLKIFSDLRLCSGTPMSHEERVTLDTWGNAESKGVWRLDRSKALDAVERGHDMDNLRTFLAERDDQPLPEKVEGFLRSVERNGNALKEQGRALLIECSSEEIAARLATDKLVSKLCLPAGKKHLVVKAGSEAAFRKAARAFGFGMPRA